MSTSLRLDEYNTQTVSKRYFDRPGSRMKVDLLDNTVLGEFACIFSFFYVEMLRELSDNPDQWWVYQRLDRGGVPVTVDFSTQQERGHVRNDDKIWIEESKEAYQDQFDDPNTNRAAGDDYDFQELIRDVVMKNVVGRLYVSHLTMNIAGSGRRNSPSDYYEPYFHKVEQSSRSYLYYSGLYKLLKAGIPLLTRRLRQRLLTAAYRHYVRPTPAKKEQLWNLMTRYFGITLHLAAERPINWKVKHHIQNPELSTNLIIGRRSRYKTSVDVAEKYKTRYEVRLF